MKNGFMPTEAKPTKVTIRGFKYDLVIIDELNTNMNHQFDLEQQIMGCWGVVDDIQMLLDSYDKLDDDDLQNLLIGMKAMYQLKFERTFETFEKLIHEAHELRAKRSM